MVFQKVRSLTRVLETRNKSAQSRLQNCFIFKIMTKERKIDDTSVCTQAKHIELSKKICQKLSVSAADASGRKEI